jgi:hypothetical protein
MFSAPVADFVVCIHIGLRLRQTNLVPFFRRAAFPYEASRKCDPGCIRLAQPPVCMLVVAFAVPHGEFWRFGASGLSFTLFEARLWQEIGSS